MVHTSGLGKYSTQEIMAELTARGDLTIFGRTLEQINQDRERLHNINRVIKSYGLIDIVKNINIARKNGWTSINIPVPIDHKLTDYSSLYENIGE